MSEPDRPQIIPSEVDPDVECVRIDDASPPAQPPGPAGPSTGPRLCPEGYLPRRRRRDEYLLEGKRIVTPGPPTPGPDPDPGRVVR